ncbi:MAG: hypothetical protein WBD20_11400 [Pirellulaceae bacterium]
MKPLVSIRAVIEEHTRSLIRERDLQHCLAVTERLLLDIPTTPYHRILSLDFTNCPQDTAAFLDDWIDEHDLSDSTPSGSSYVQMNGFDGNADQWHFHWFAYSRAPSNFDYSYLGDGWVSEDKPETVLLGMEELQQIYRARDQRPEFSFAEDVCSWMVVFRFLSFMRAVGDRMRDRRRPLVVSVHNWDPMLELFRDR